MCISICTKQRTTSLFLLAIGLFLSNRHTISSWAPSTSYSDQSVFWDCSHMRAPFCSSSLDPFAQLLYSIFFSNIIPLHSMEPLLSFIMFSFQSFPIIEKFLQCRIMSQLRMLILDVHLILFLHDRYVSNKIVQKKILAKWKNSRLVPDLKMQL